MSETEENGSVHNMTKLSKKVKESQAFVEARRKKKKSQETNPECKGLHYYIQYQEGLDKYLCSV